jgi:hypothetical protein
LIYSTMSQFFFETLHLKNWIFESTIIPWDFLLAHELDFLYYFKK